jgi:hypothetical protein
MALPLLLFFYTWFVCKLGVLANKLYADFMCIGVVWKKCKKRMNQGSWTKDLRQVVFLERGGM